MESLSDDDPCHQDDCFASRDPIESAKCDRTPIPEICNMQSHLTLNQRAMLNRLLSWFPKLFNNELKTFPDCKAKLEVDPLAQLSHKRRCSVVRVHQQVFKEELDQPVWIGALSKVGCTDWMSPALVIPKKMAWSHGLAISGNSTKF